MPKKFPGTFIWIVGFLALLLSSKVAPAESPAQLLSSDLGERFAKLEAQITALGNQLTEQTKKHQEEIETLRRQIEIKGPVEEKPSYVGLPPEAMPKWLEGLEMGGDLRLRAEAFEQNEATRDRTRFRYRLRWKTVKHLAEDLDLGFRLVSGSNTDPTSTNQTLTGDFTFKGIFVDQVYAKYRPSFLKEHVPYLEKMEISAGKFENPFADASTGLVWDSDVTPEGLAESLEFNFLEGKFKPFVNLGQFILQENATAADAELFGFQQGLRWSAPDLGEVKDVRLTHALAYYDFTDYARDSNFLVSGASLARGNTTLGPFLLAGDFDILQIYNELQFKIRGFPVKLFTDFAANLADRTPDPDDRNLGYEYGLKLGSAKTKGDWEAIYYYATIEPNAVVGAFSDSDFGTGHANKRGSGMHFRYKLTDTLKWGVNTYFVNNVLGADDETRRFSTDLEWAF